MTIKIVAVDGPAGCGKSSLIRELIDQGLVRPAHPGYSVDRPRNYGNSYYQDNGAGLSMAKNYLQVISAIQTAIEHNEDVPIILDRYGLSQFVYGTLRSLGQVWSQNQFSEYWENEMMILDGIFEHYAYRKAVGNPGRDRHSHLYDFYSVIFLPKIETVKIRRKNKAKDYPFNLEEEHRFYSRLHDWDLNHGYSRSGINHPSYKVESYVETLALFAKVIT